MKDKISVSIKNQECKGCGLCVTYCPKKVLELSEGINGMGYHPVTLKDIEKCTGCGICYQMCPDVVFHIERITNYE